MGGEISNSPALSSLEFFYNENVLEGVYPLQEHVLIFKLGLYILKPNEVKLMNNEVKCH